jgi:hypothetical protein
LGEKGLANIGLALPDWMVVIDLDGDEGRAWLESFVEEFDALPPTVMQKTRRSRFSDYSPRKQKAEHPTNVRPISRPRRISL